MYCVKCNEHVVFCSCPDIKERLAAIASHPNIDISRTMKEIERLEKEGN